MRLRENGGLLADVDRAVAEVRALGPDRIGEFDGELVPSLSVEGD